MKVEHLFLIKRMFGHGFKIRQLKGKKKVLKLFFVKTQKGNHHQQIIFIILFFEIIDFFFLRQHAGFVV